MRWYFLLLGMVCSATVEQVTHYRSHLDRRADQGTRFPLYTNVLARQLMRNDEFKQSLEIVQSSISEHRNRVAPELTKDESDPQSAQSRAQIIENEARDFVNVPPEFEIAVRKLHIRSESPVVDASSLALAQFVENFQGLFRACKRTCIFDIDPHRFVVETAKENRDTGTFFSLVDSIEKDLDDATTHLGRLPGLEGVLQEAREHLEAKKSQVSIPVVDVEIPSTLTIENNNIPMIKKSYTQNPQSANLISANSHKVGASLLAGQWAWLGRHFDEQAGTTVFFEDRLRGAILRRASEVLDSLSFFKISAIAIVDEPEAEFGGGLLVTSLLNYCKNNTDLSNDRAFVYTIENSLSNLNSRKLINQVGNSGCNEVKTCLYLFVAELLDNLFILGSANRLRNCFQEQNYLFEDLRNTYKIFEKDRGGARSQVLTAWGPKLAPLKLIANDFTLKKLKKDFREVEEAFEVVHTQKIISPHHTTILRSFNEVPIDRWDVNADRWVLEAVLSYPCGLKTLGNPFACFLIKRFSLAPAFYKAMAKSITDWHEETQYSYPSRVENSETWRHHLDIIVKNATKKKSAFRTAVSGILESGEVDMIADYVATLKGPLAKVEFEIFKVISHLKQLPNGKDLFDEAWIRLKGDRAKFSSVVRNASLMRNKSDKCAVFNIIVWLPYFENDIGNFSEWSAKSLMNYPCGVKRYRDGTECAFLRTMIEVGDPIPTYEAIKGGILDWLMNALSDSSPFLAALPLSNKAGSASGWSKPLQMILWNAAKRNPRSAELALQKLCACDAGYNPKLNLEKNLAAAGLQVRIIN